MARGWESKAIESQQQDADTRKNPAPQLSGPQRIAATRRRTLELARSKAVSDLAAASNETHRRMLTDTIAAIDERLAALDAEK